MSDLSALIALIMGGVSAIALALLQARRSSTRATTQTLKDKDISHAQDISNAVARSRADHRSPDADRLPDAADKRGWRN